jgi:hypothetical protein
MFANSSLGLMFAPCFCPDQSLQTARAALEELQKQAESLERSDQRLTRQLSLDRLRRNDVASDATDAQEKLQQLLEITTSVSAALTEQQHKLLELPHEEITERSLNLTKQVTELITLSEKVAKSLSAQLNQVDHIEDTAMKLYKVRRRSIWNCCGCCLQLAPPMMAKPLKADEIQLSPRHSLQNIGGSEEEEEDDDDDNSPLLSCTAV